MTEITFPATRKIASLEKLLASADRVLKEGEVATEVARFYQALYSELQNAKFDWAASETDAEYIVEVLGDNVLDKDKAVRDLTVHIAKNAYDVEP